MFWGLLKPSNGDHNMDVNISPGFLHGKPDLGPEKEWKLDDLAGYAWTCWVTVNWGPSK